MIKKVTATTKAILSFLLALILIIPTPVLAFDDTPSESTLDFYNANGIYYYNPVGSDCVTIAVGAYNGTPSTGLSAVQAGFVDAYHNIAEQLSIEFGIPWEAVMAQGILESTAGTSHFATTRNNFFGIGAYDSDTNQARYYETPAAGWRGYYANILATSTYRAHGAFQNDYHINYTPKPNGYSGTIRDNVTNPFAYLQTVWDSGYATDSDYYNKVAQFIPAIINRAQENGWLTSEELAAAHPEMLSNAAINAAGANTGSVSDGSIQASSICVGEGQGNGDINSTALNLAWPDRTNGTTPKPTYKTALQYLGMWNDNATDENQCAGIGASCDRFVTAVMRYSGVDTAFPQGSAASLIDYMSNSELYEEIPNIGNSSNLQPGDILGVTRDGSDGSTGHVMFYVQKEDGNFAIASASLCDHSPDLASSYTPNDSISGKPWRIFRFKSGGGGSTSSDTTIASSANITTENVTITIPGLSDTYRIAWVSDMHIIADGATYIGEERLNMFKSTSGTDTVATWQSIINFLNNQNFNAVIFGGDIIDYYSTKNYQTARDGLNQLKMPWFYIYGSGDHDFYTGRTNDNTDSSLSNDSSAGAGDVIDLGGIKIVGLNDSSNANISSSTLDAVASIIKNAGKPVILATHVPFKSNIENDRLTSSVQSVHNGQVYFWDSNSSNWKLGNNSAMNSFLNNNVYSDSTNVKAVLAGHVHELSGDFKLTNTVVEHIFKAGFKGNVGVVTVKGN